MLITILEILWTACYEMFKAIINLIIELLPTINFFNDIAGAFSWQSILAYSIGVPTVLISVTLLIIKLYIKHKKL